MRTHLRSNLRSAGFAQSFPGKTKMGCYEESADFTILGARNSQNLSSGDMFMVLAFPYQIHIGKKW
jgi:hypothetical protein